MILAIVSVLAVVFFATAVLLVFKYGDKPVGGVAEFSSIPDTCYSEWATETGALYPESGGYGSVSLREEGEAWRSTLCHGPNDCSS